MKRFFLTLCALCASTAIWAATASDLYYTVSNGEVTIKECNKSALGGLIIPETLGGYPVTSIGSWAFDGCSGLTSVTIPSSVTSIGYQAFSDCSGLTSVTIPSSVTLINWCVFSYCSSLTSIVIPEGVTTIVDSAFSNCSGLTSVTIPSSVTSIGNGAFYNVAPTTLTAAWLPSGMSSDNLTTLIIPEGTTSIPADAFKDCKSLTSVTIPASVTSIGNNAFSGCTALKNVYISDLSAWCKIDFSNAASNPIYYAQKFYLNGEIVEDLVIPEGVTKLEFGIFYGCTALKSVVIPSTVTSIEEDAFCYCSSLTSITIPSSVTSIGNFAFYRCSGLTSITIPSSVTSIGSSAFRDCTSLTSVTIPEGVTSIGDYAFEDCSSLTSVTIPSSLTSIGRWAFEGCSGLKEVHISDIAAWCAIDFEASNYNPLYYAKSLYLNGSLVKDLVIPEGVTTIRESAFIKCLNLEAVTFPSTLTSVGGFAFSGCSNLTSISIPEGVTSIGDCAFYGCSNATFVTLPNSLTSIEEDTFYNVAPETLIAAKFPNGGMLVDNLTTVIIPEGTTSIPANAFKDYTALTSITIPASVTSIGASAFSGCTALKNVYISDLSAWCAIKFGNTSASPFYYSGQLYVNGTRITELVIPNNVTLINAYAFYNCSGITSVVIPNSETSTGSSSFSGIAPETLMATRLPSGMSKTYLKSVTIPDGTTTLSSSAFSGCSEMTSVTIPESVTKIENYVFKNCSALISIEIPSSVTSIGTEAFSGCTALKNVYISDISAWCAIAFGDNFSSPFYYGAKLNVNKTPMTALTIPNGVTSIGRSAFCGCSSLVSVAIPSSVTSVGSSAFFGCTGLKNVYISNLAAWCSMSFGSDSSNPLYHGGNLSVNGKLVTELLIPNGITSIGSYAFKNCASIESVTIPESVTSIGSSAFSGIAPKTLCAVKFPECGMSLNNLTTLIIPEGTTSIPADAFKDCKSLTSVTIPASVTSIGSNAFSGCTALTDVYISDIVAWCAIDFANLTSNPITLAKRFYLNDLLVTNLVIPEEVTTIKYAAFNACSELKSVTLPSGLTTIANAAFRYTGLTSIMVPDGVTSIGDEAFYNCSSLTAIKIASSVTSVGTQAFFGVKPLEVDAPWWIVNLFPLTQMTEMVIADGVEEIPANHLKNNKTLESVRIPASVKVISTGAFSGCTALRSVKLSEGVTTIEDEAFRNCSQLESITIPASVKTIGKRVFTGCGEVNVAAGNRFYKSVDGVLFSADNRWLHHYPVDRAGEYSTPRGVQFIDEEAFAGNKVITQVILTGVATIEDYAFKDCSALERCFVSDGLGSIQLGAFENATSLHYFMMPETVSNLEITAFKNCPSLGTVAFQGKPPFVLWGDEEVFSGDEYTQLVGTYFPEHREDWAIVVDAELMWNGLKMVGDSYSNATEGNFHYQVYGGEATITGVVSPITGECVLPTTLGDYFVTGIGRKAFARCIGMTSVTIPECVTSIGSNAFSSCTSLDTVIFRQIPPETVGDDAFTEANGYYLPDYATEWFLATDDEDMWHNLAMQEWEDSNAATDVSFFTYTIANGSVTITKLQGDYPANIVIPSQIENLPVVAIGDYAFMWCDAVTSVVIPEGVTSIGDWAFSACSGLTSITIPSSVTSIGDYAFYNCTGLTSITIPEGVISIGDSAFSDCSALETIQLPDSVTSIGDGAFFRCGSLKTMPIPEGVTTIASSAFLECDSLTAFVVDSTNATYKAVDGLLLSKDGKRLFKCPGGMTSVKVPNSVTVIETGAFMYSKSLSTVDIPEGVEDLYMLSFCGCTSLVEVTIPSSVDYVGDMAFTECTTLTSVNFLGDPSIVVVDGAFPETNGYYMPEHASAWEAVIVDGKWENLTMQMFGVEEKTATITFNANGGIGGVSEELVCGSNLTPPVVTRTGYTFIGWEPEVPAKVPASDVTYTAQWQKNDDPAHTPPSWEVSNYQNNMVVYAQVKDITTGTFIEAEGSLFAAFDADGVCRGVVEAIDIDLEHKVYQLTVCSDGTAGEVLTLKIWNAETGEIIDLNETITFEADLEIGLLWEPVVYQVGLSSLSLTLNPGWNWCSINVDAPAGTSLGDFFSGWTPVNGDQIKAGTQTATYYNGEWRPSTFVVAPGKMYLIKNSAETAVSATVTGTLADVNEAIDVASGWNWIGYTGKAPVAVAEAFADTATFANGDTIKANTSTATYYNGAWRGTLTLTPGQGYKLKVASATTVQYVEASGTSEVAAASLLSATAAPDWSVKNYQYNMVVYATIQDGDGTMLEADGSLLAAFDANGICRGCIDPLDIGIGVKVYQLTVCSDELTEAGLTLKFWDAATGTIYDVDATIDFKSDTEIGLLWEPVSYSIVETVVESAVTIEVVGNGTVTGAGQYAEGDEVTLTAIAQEGWVFCGWNTNPLTTDATYTFTMGTEEVALTACFAPVLAIEQHVSAHKLMTREDAKQALLDADEVFTADEMKEMAFEAPVVEVGADAIEISISLQTAETLNAWEAMALQGATLEVDEEAGKVRVRVPKGDKKGAFYKFVVPTDQSK